MSLDAYHHLYLPAKPGAPLLFLFHGTGGTEQQFVQFGRQLLPEAGIVSPLGDVSEHGAARFFRRTGEGAYDMADLERATHKMAAFVRSFVEEAKPSAVIGLGYSNGANILASTTFLAPDLFDAAVLLHPLIPFTPQFASPPKTRYVITAGQRDPICPAPMTQKLAETLQANNAQVNLAWHEGGHEIRSEEITFVNQELKPWNMANEK